MLEDTQMIFIMKETECARCQLLGIHDDDVDCCVYLCRKCVALKIALKIENKKMTLLQEYIAALTTGNELFTDEEMIKFAPIRKALSEQKEIGINKLNTILVELNMRVKEIVNNGKEINNQTK